MAARSRSGIGWQELGNVRRKPLKVLVGRQTGFFTGISDILFQTAQGSSENGGKLCAMGIREGAASPEISIDSGQPPVRIGTIFEAQPSEIFETAKGAGDGL